MKEIERINNNNNGELPSGDFDIIRIKNIPNPEQELNNFKRTVIAFLENRDLEWDDPKWLEVLPDSIVKFTEQLNSMDFHKDDLITNISSLIDGLKDVRDWEWYSSKIMEDGFEVYMQGMFRYIFRPLLHQQGIPHTSIFVERAGKEYPTHSLTDVLTYRAWDPDTLDLT